MTFSRDKLRNSNQLTPGARSILDRARILCIKDREPFTAQHFPDLNYGSVRNAFCQLRNAGKIKRVIRDKHAYFWVCGVPEPRTGWARMTTDHTGVAQSASSGRSNCDLLRILKNLPLGEQCIHDIHLEFSAPGLYSTLKNSEQIERIVPRCNDLMLRPIGISENRVAKISVHQTDTVSIVLGCTLDPYPINEDGIFQFHTSLGIIQGSLSTLLKGVKLP